MKIIQEIGAKQFPLQWANLADYRESIAYRKEVYLKDNENPVYDLINLFYNLFDKYKSNILVYNESWWDFTLETWDFKRDIYDYSVKNKSKESVDYILMLKDSEMREGYSGSCKCENWNVFLRIILSCIISGKAIYSPIFYNEKENFFFYFHHTGSIGIYYEEENETIIDILNSARLKYLLV